MPTIDDKLANHPFLKGMKPEHRAILARHASEAQFMTDQVIFREGETAYQFYLILEGKVSAESHAPTADGIPLQIIASGEVLGWSSLFPPFSWYFQARALEPTKAIFLDGARLVADCEQDHSFGYQLMERIAQVIITRLEATQKRLLEIQETTGLLPVADGVKHEGVSARLDARSLEDMLAEHPFFQGMSAEHLKILANAAMKAKFEAGQIIFREGDPANRFYLIQQGKVVLEAPRREATAVPFQIIGAGDVLGWSWLFPPFYSHFEARALEPTQSIFLHGTQLRKEAEQNHDLGYALMKRTVAVVMQRLQATRRRLVEIPASKNVQATAGATRTE